MGNRRSVEKALERVGARVALTADHDALRAADGLVVPGVGAFAAAMRAMRELGLDELVRERAGGATPVLGVCLGMQLLFERRRSWRRPRARAAARPGRARSRRRR